MIVCLHIDICIYVHDSFSHVQPAATTLPGASLLRCMVAQGPGFPFGFPTWTAVPTLAFAREQFVFLCFQLPCHRAFVNCL